MSFLNFSEPLFTHREDRTQGSLLTELYKTPLPLPEVKLDTIPPQHLAHTYQPQNAQGARYKSVGASFDFLRFSFSSVKSDDMTPLCWGAF